MKKYHTVRCILVNIKDKLYLKANMDWNSTYYNKMSNYSSERICSRQTSGKPGGLSATNSASTRLSHKIDGAIKACSTSKPL
jgi:hypothetical protein